MKRKPANNVQNAKPASNVTNAKVANVQNNSRHAPSNRCSEPPERKQERIEKIETHKVFDLLWSILPDSEVNRQKFRTSVYKLWNAVLDDVEGIIDPYKGGGHIAVMSKEQREKCVKFASYLVSEYKGLVKTSAAVREWAGKCNKYIECNGKDVAIIQKFLSEDKFIQKIRTKIDIASLKRPQISAETVIDVPVTKEMTPTEHYVAGVKAKIEGNELLMEEYFRIAAEKQHAEAAWQLYKYLEAKAVNDDQKEEAQVFLDKAVHGAYFPATQEVMQRYSKGGTTPYLKGLEMAAQAKDATSLDMYTLARYYAYWNNLSQAEKWYKKSIEKDGSFENQVSNLVDAIFPQSQETAQKEEILNAINYVLKARNQPNLVLDNIDNKEELKNNLIKIIPNICQDAPDKITAFLQDIQKPEAGLSKDNPLKTYKSQHINAKLELSQMYAAHSDLFFISPTKLQECVDFIQAQARNMNSKARIMCAQTMELMPAGTIPHEVEKYFTPEDKPKTLEDAKKKTLGALSKVVLDMIAMMEWSIQEGNLRAKMELYCDILDIEVRYNKLFLDMAAKDNNDLPESYDRISSAEHIKESIEYLERMAHLAPGSTGDKGENNIDIRKEEADETEIGTRYVSQALSSLINYYNNQQNEEKLGYWYAYMQAIGVDMEPAQRLSEEQKKNMAKIYFQKIVEVDESTITDVCYGKGSDTISMKIAYTDNGDKEALESKLKERGIPYVAGEEGRLYIRPMHVDYIRVGYEAHLQGIRARLSTTVGTQSLGR